VTNSMQIRTRASLPKETRVINFITMCLPGWQERAGWCSLVQFTGRASDFDWSTPSGLLLSTAAGDCSPVN